VDVRRCFAVLVLGGCGRFHFGDLRDADGDGVLAGDARQLQMFYLKASNPDGYDAFGGALGYASDGATLAVGAIDEDSAASGINGDQSDNSLTRAGAAYVLVRGGTSWTQQAYIKASNPGLDDVFGYAIALSGDGNTLAVGAPLEDSAATGIDGNQNDETAMDAGAVYVFARTGTTWSQQAYIKASNTAAGDQFGSSVALSADGTTLAVGAPIAATSTGEAYVFARVGVTWSQEALLQASNADPNDQFGSALALSGDGNTLAIGAPGEASGTGNPSDNSQPDSGAVYVFLRSGTWAQQAYLKGTPAIGGDFVGQSVALAPDGNTLAAGAGGEDSIVINSGGVFVYARNGGTWGQPQLIKASNPGDSDEFGSSVALVAGSLVVGSPLEDSAAAGLDGNQLDESQMDSGAAYLYEQTGSLWTQTHYVKALSPGLGDRFGSSAALVATGVALGAPGEGGSSGAVYEYDR
jgi:hypothetical protein